MKIKPTTQNNKMMKKKLKTSNDDDNTGYKPRVSPNLQNAVKEHNIEDIRGSLWSCIAVDPTLTGMFKVSLDYVLSNGISENELYENDDGEIFDLEPTDDNFNKLGGALSTNFSKKKLNDLKKIGTALYG